MFDADLEDRQDEAVRKIQRKARIFIAKCRLIKLTRSNYLKKYDRINDIYYYKNKTSGAILQDKPVCLGKDDLPDPRDFEAPEGYDAEDEEDSSKNAGFAIVLVNNEFPASNGKLPRLPASVVSEYLALEDVLTHDFICKFPPENTFFMNNAKCAEFRDTLDRLRTTIKKRNFLFLYVCTHVLTVVGGQPKTAPHETAYFAMTDSVFTKPEDIAKSCISLTDLTKLVNKFPCKKKTVVVNFAHTPMPPKSYFAPVKCLYPPNDVLSRMANMMDCAVLASCINGCNVKDALRQGPHRMKAVSASASASVAADDRDKDKDKAHKGQGKGQGHDLTDKAAQHSDTKNERPNSHSGKHGHATGGEGEGEGGGDREHDEDEHALAVAAGVAAAAEAGIGDRPASGGQVVAGDHKDGGDEEDSDNGDDRDYENEDFQTALGGGFNHHAHLAHKHAIVAPSDPTQKIVDSYLEYWCVPPDPPITITQKPVRPLPAWKRDEETNNEFEITLPTESDHSAHRKAMLLWRIKRILRPPINYVKQKYREYLRRNVYAPEQHNIYLPGEEFSLFGAALIQALQGEAHKPGKKQVTVKMLFDYIKDWVPKKLKEHVEKTNKELDGKLSATLAVLALGDEEAVGWMPDDEFKLFKDEIEKSRIFVNSLAGQSPSLFIPYNNPKAGKFPVCCRCGPAAAPGRPYIKRTGLSEIALEWYEQPFDGVPPAKYSVEVKNHTRVFHDWQVVKSPADITTSTFIVRNLPSGVPCKFRCRAYNQGGWSQYSEPSQMVTPGDSLTPMPTVGRWRRVVQGGALGTLDLLESRPLNRNEHIIGLHKILAFVSSDNGFKKVAIQLKVANAAMHGLLTFTYDPEIAKVAFTLLGWCLQEGSPGQKRSKIYLRKLNIDAICADYMQQHRFRLDTQIMGALEFLRAVSLPLFPAGSQGSIPSPPPLIIPEDTDVNVNDDEEEERKAVEEDRRKVEERIKAEQDEKDFLERTAKAKALEKAKADADEMAKKKAEKREREREREKEANKYK